MQKVGHLPDADYDCAVYDLCQVKNMKSKVDSIRIIGVGVQIIGYPKIRSESAKNKKRPLLKEISLLSCNKLL